MIGKLSTEQLTYLLKRLRIITGLPDPEAIDELDGFLWLLSIQNASTDYDSEDDNPNLDEALNHPTGEELASNVEEALSDLQRQVARSYGSEWQLQSQAENHLKNLSVILQEPTKFMLNKTLQSRIEAANAGFERLLADLNVAHASKWLDAACEYPISRYSSVEKILNDIDRNIDTIIQFGQITDSQKNKINEARTRCAWYRANKTLQEADVARSGGNQKKHDRLRGEAAAQLRQDWKRAFGNEQFPDINSS